MTKVVILGLGNDLLTDDAIGLRVVHEVRNRLAGDQRIDIHETTETGLALLDFVVRYDCLIVVDAIHTGRHPAGFVHEFEPGDFREHVAPTPHAVNVERLCQVGRSRGLPVPHWVRIFGIEVGDAYTMSDQLTPPVEEAVEEAADLVVQRALEFAELPPSEILEA